MIASRSVNVAKATVQSRLAPARPFGGPALRARTPLLVRATGSGLSGSNSAEELRKAGESVKKAASAALGSAADAVKNMKLLVRAAESGLSGSNSAEELRKAGESVKKAASAALGSAADAVKNMKVPDMAKLDVDIRQTVTWNFLAQLALTAISWGIAFVTSHTSMAKGAGVHPTTALLMIGVLLSGYSAYLSYTYLLKVKSDGLNVLQGWNQLKDFNDHLFINFAGAAATLMALQAEVGLLMMGGMTKQAGGLAVEALAQASANTLTAHIVSIFFLTFMIRKVTAAYQRVLEWGENLSKSMPRLS